MHTTIKHHSELLQQWWKSQFKLSPMQQFRGLGIILIGREGHVIITDTPCSTCMGKILAGFADRRHCSCHATKPFS